MTLARPIWFAWKRLYISRASTRVLSPGPPSVSTKMRSKNTSDPTTMRVDEVMIVYFSWGRVILKNMRTRPAPSSWAASYIDLGIWRTAPW